MQTGSSGTLIGWKSGQTTFVPLWDQLEGAWINQQFLTHKVTKSTSCLPFRFLEFTYIALYKLFANLTSFFNSHLHV